MSGAVGWNPGDDLVEDKRDVDLSEPPPGLPFRVRDYRRWLHFRTLEQAIEVQKVYGIRQAVQQRIGDDWTDVAEES